MTINEFDSRVGTIIVSWPAWLHPIMIGASFLGLPLVVGVVSVSSALAAFKIGRPKIAWSFVAALVGLGGNTLIKYGLHRVRPNTPFAMAMKIKSYSFPSGHAFGSVVVYGLMAFLAYRSLSSPWNLLTAGGLVGLVVLIGLSRVYLGAHYPTDVLGGWVLGLVVLGLIMIFIKP